MGDDNVNLSKVDKKVVEKEKYKAAQLQSNKKFKAQSQRNNKLNGEKSVNDVLDQFMNVGIEEKSPIDDIENSSTSKVWLGDKIDEEKDNVINKQTFGKKTNNKRKRAEKNKK